MSTCVPPRGRSTKGHPWQQAQSVAPCSWQRTHVCGHRAPPAEAQALRSCSCLPWYVQAQSLSSSSYSVGATVTPGSVCSSSVPLSSASGATSAATATAGTTTLDTVSLYHPYFAYRPSTRISL